ncbi:MAG: 3-oxoacyl-[acyl-carrier-protein] reductase [Peptococcaceae bacterium]|jgi:3-oxoacyl-[acyl-carrier protein] reductase|nr:3-oxoacyl-[acyl-carrier-protein] reductase [Peptococcaceae bacterium]
MFLDGKVALVTGASRGIGRTIALELAKSGAALAINYAASREGAENTVAAIAAMGGRACALRADVSGFQAARELVEECVAALGGVDILVNNAGITRDNLILRMKEEDWDAVVDTNLKGAFNCIRSAARYMVKNRWGRIINISSVAGLSGNAGQVNYSAAKAGLIGLTKAMAKELGSRNITVNAVAPGLIDTDMTGILTDKQREKISNSIALGRLGRPGDVAALVAFLAGDAAGYISGQVIAVDGGLVI